MLRSAFVTFSLALALGVGACAQVTVNSGTATTYPAAVTPETANTVNALGTPSVPAINTPVAHVGPAAAPPSIPGETSQPAVAVESGSEIAQPADINQPLNLGVSSADINPFMTIGDQSGESLADAARQMKQERQTVNAKTYTNADIDRLNQQSGESTGLNANAQNDNWPTNNGVISPEPEGSIASPAGNQSTTGTMPPPAPAQNAAPAIENNNPPQAMNSKPSAGSPYEMAQNNPSNAGIPQQADSANTDASNSPAPKSLPKTASRLPLLGVLGFFSISMGLFVRYQREKTAK